MRSFLLLSLLMPTALAGQPTKRLSDDERGKQLYERHCTPCHGAANRGDGPATEALVADVPDLRGKVKADEATIKVLMRGRGAMPSYESTWPEPKADARRVLAYMATVHQTRSTQKPPKPPVKGKAPPPPADDAQGGDAQGAGDAQGG